MPTSIDTRRAAPNAGGEVRRRRWIVPALLAAVMLQAAAEDRGRPPAAFDFRFDVLPILQRQQCGSAYCHGAATGQGGFKLSLFGSDPEADHRVITAEFGGRRLDLVEPDASLLLRKPSGQLAHGGGRKLRRETAEYRALRDWIAAGAPRRSGEAVELQALAVDRVGDRLQVTATFAGGDGPFARDVTALCTFSSSEERVAAVDANGVVHERAAGEAWLFARYVNRTARLVVRRAFAPAVTPAVPATPDTFDELWRARLAALGLAAGPRAAPEVLARRLYLDLVDRVPTPAELDAFVASSDPRAAVAVVADQLLQTPEFAAKFGRHLAQWFEIPPAGADLPAPQAAMFARERQALVDDVARGASLGEIVRRLVVQEARLFDRLPDPRDRAELFGRAVLGVRIGCARCHDSPTDRWRRGDHLRFSALFASPRPDAQGGMQAGVLFDPDTRQPVPPQLLPVPLAGPPPEAPPREQLLWFALASGSGLFEQNVANRVFATLLGRGLVEPLDDHRDSNPALHETLLARLADRARGGDLRALVREVLTSELYQAVSDEADEGARRWFARREARALDGATFVRAVAALLGTAPPELPPASSPLARELLLRNGELLHAAVDASPVLAAIARLPADQQLQRLFSLVLGRAPREHERDAFAAVLEAAIANGDERALSDLAYALLASREFTSLR
ncbi:MAG: DUF1549 domain-containing protein [Planctomycetota bacterium]